ncbi:hypothetical protein SAMN05216276_108334 [Streptosporangium subroseum]|uniref:Uncharacterized protein n=1 Tax=Streptosporangium subroseum TaxID=106412 RepID=A0A239P456_9ACTN|nr:hypothetical protein [Streptosporangium subroseum]SNT61408.1 hypothetical protein SAMN05216276_108334 [Streptosporangium subroseum]
MADAAGLWTLGDLEARPRPADEFRPVTGEPDRTARRTVWHEAVGRATSYPAHANEGAFPAHANQGAFPVHAGQEAGGGLTERSGI